MTPGTLRWGVLLALVLTWLGACVPLEVETETEAWQGEHLEYVWESGLRPCDGIPEYSDGFVPFAAAQLGLDVDSFGPLSFTFLSRDAFHRLGVYEESEGVSGFARGSEAYSYTPTHLHEIAHIVVHERKLGGLRFFVEGLAEALDQGGTAQRILGSGGQAPRHERVDPRPVFDERRRDGSQVYRVGGAFTTYLLSRYGAERLWELHEGLRSTSSPERVARVFERVYGLDLDDEVETYLHDDTCPEDASERPQPYACTGRTIPWESAERWSDVRSFRCYAEPDGDGEPVLWSSRARTIEIPEDGLYRVSVFGDERSNVHLLPCGPCPWLALDTHLGQGAGVVPLRAGLHGIVYSPGFREPSVLGVVIEPVDQESP